MNQDSAIGRFSAHAADRLLARGHRVHLLATELEATSKAFLKSTNATITHWSEMSRDELRQDYDVVFVNVGDHYLYHAGIFWILDQVPALGIFHDYYLYDLFHGWLWDHGRSHGDRWRDETHDRIVMETYKINAASARQLREAVQQGVMPLESIANVTPMTEWILKRCGAAFGHAQFYQDRLKSGCTGRVDWSHLPALSRGVPLKSDLPELDEQLVALTVGIMNPNKCVDRVIEAIGRSPDLSGRLEYRLAGQISPEERARLTALAKSLNYDGLRILGVVDESGLKEQLTNADIICCLRRPVLEGASGSAVEALLAGRPVIVADVGFYSELPDGVLFKIPQDLPLEALSACLTQLVNDKALRLAAGEVAKHWAERHLNLDYYLDKLEGFAGQFVDDIPLLRLGRHVGESLTKLDFSSDDEAVLRIAKSLDGFVAKTDGRA